MNSIIVDKPLKNEKVNKKYDGDSLKVGFYRTGTPVDSNLLCSI